MTGCVEVVVGVGDLVVCCCVIVKPFLDIMGRHCGVGGSASITLVLYH